MALEVLIERPEARCDLGEGDPQRLHRPSLARQTPEDGTDGGALGGTGGVAGKAPRSGRGVPSGPSDGGTEPAGGAVGAPRPTAWTCSAEPATSSAKWQATS